MTFAVIKTGGKQYLVHVGTRIRLEKLPQKEGETVTFSEVLLLHDSGGSTHVGVSTVPDAVVEARILRQGRAPKIIVFKYKPKKRYRKKRGYRHHFSEVEILAIKKAGEKTPAKIARRASRITEPTPRKIKTEKKA